MQDRFDPNLQWLGVRSAGRRPDYYQLLQLDRFENDAEVVMLAADRSMARVRGERPGGHVAEWQQLLDELATAKQCLTDVTQKAEYDRRLREGSLPEAIPPLENPPHDPSIVDLTPEALFPPDHRTTPAAQPMPESTSLSANEPATDMSVAAQEPSRRPVVIAVVLAPVLLLAAAAAGLMSVFGPDENRSVVNDRQDVGADDQHVPTQRSSPAALPAKKTSDAVGPPLVPASKPSETSPAQSPPSSIGSSSALTRPQSLPQPRPQPGPPTVPAKPAISEPTSGPTPVRPSRPVSPPASTLPETKPEPAAETEKPPASTPPAEAQPTPRQTAAFNRAVTEVIRALQRRDTAMANRNLDVAETNAISQDQKDRLARVRQLQQYAGEFFKAAQAGYDSLEGDEELVIGGERMVVVDRTPKELTIRRKGRNQSFSPATMPDALTLALADHWFDQKNPTNKVFIGAFQALRGRIDVAREIWQRASREGVSEVDFLLPVLKDIPRRLTNDE